MTTWQKVKLAELWKESKIESTNPNSDRRIKVKLNVQGVEKRPDKNDQKGATKYFIRKAGQFIYGKQNFHKGAFGIIPNELDNFESSSDIPAFDVNHKCNPEWIYYFFKQGEFYKQLEKYSKGTGSKRIHPDKIAHIEISLPSRKEQDKIISELKLQERKISELSNINNKNESFISSLRHQILQEAIQGKLVKQDPKDEPASELLKKIKAEKEKLIKEGKIKKQKTLPPISEDEIPYDLPKGWEWVRLGDVSALENYSFVDGPFGSNLKSEHYVEKGIRIIQLQNIGEGFWKEGKNVYTSENKANELIRCNAYPGELVIAKMAPVARATIIPPLHRRYVLCSDCVKFKPHKSININYIRYLLNSEIIKKIVIFDSTGMTRQRTSLGKLRLLTIPLPPLSEQKRIVEKVDKLMGYCDELEKQVKGNQENAEKLMVAGLKESFETTIKNRNVY